MAEQLSQHERPAPDGERDRPASHAALVTGSTGGLGLAVARSLAATGANVCLHGLCDTADGDGVAQELAATYGVTAMFDGADLTNVAAIERLVARAAERIGPLDILVNNAVVRHFSPVDSFAVADWDEAMAVNLNAAFHLIRLTVPDMKRKGYGRIVNMSSIYGSRGAENRIDYVTTKTALIGLTRAAAIELAKTGITCNAVCPGTVPSPAILQRIDAMAAERGVPVEDVTRDYLDERHPTGRFVAAESVGSLIAFLCGPAGADITGAVLPVDGGWLAR